jgi:hypothetical protein
VHSDNKEQVMKNNQYGEVQEYTEKKYRVTATRKGKTEKATSVT